jgi:hypothetical protein
VCQIPPHSYLYITQDYPRDALLTPPYGLVRGGGRGIWYRMQSRFGDVSEKGVMG